MDDKAEHDRFIAAVREAIEDVKAGHVMDLDEAMDEIRRELGLWDEKQPAKGRGVAKRSRARTKQ